MARGVPKKESIRVAFVALGCAKNLVDSEKMLGLLAEADMAITADPDDADVIVINTCGFLDAARVEAHEAIAEAVAHKRTGRCRRVVVAGCLVERDGPRLLEAVAGIDALVGVHARDDIVRAVIGQDEKDVVDGQCASADLYLGPYHPHVASDMARLRLTPRHYAYLRISEGCDRKCTFCTIPAIRGPLRSKPLEAVIDEARELVGDGVREINLIGQDTTSYGMDRDDGVGLADVLRALDRVDGLRWVRLLYAYPTTLTDRIIDAVGACERVVKYVDLPLQHINDRVLKAMGRGIDRAGTERLLEKLRARIPGVAIRTTLLVGFPGESESEFEELLRFVEQAHFAAVGVFAYSTEPGTPAGRMKNQLPPDVRRRRADTIMEAQQKVAFAEAAKQVGRDFEIVVDGSLKAGQFVGRHAGQAPEVDSVCYVLADDLRAGRFLRTRCVGWQDYDLIVRPLEAIVPTRSARRRRSGPKR